MKTPCKFFKGEGAMQTRLRPLILQQIAAMRAWRLPTRSAKLTASKKGLLFEDKPTTVAMANIVIGYGALRVSTKPTDRLNHLHSQPKLPAQPQHGDHHDHGRIIGPGSPSFRIFFEDAASHARPDQIGDNEVLKETDSPPEVGLSKESSVKKKVKREIKMRRHIKSVMLAKRRVEKRSKL